MIEYSDGDFVDAMLRQAQAALGDDPRVHFAHVAHAGARPAEPTTLESSAHVSGVRSALSQASSLAVRLRELWQHAWLPDVPSLASVRFVEDNQEIRAEVGARFTSSDPTLVGLARDRLLVRGFIADSSDADGFIARCGTEAIVISAADGYVSVILSAALDDTGLTVDALTGLPAEVSTQIDRPEG